MYMISDATTALLSLPRLISQRPSKSLMTVTRKRFSVSSSAHTRLASKRARINNIRTHGTGDRTNSPAERVEVLP